MANIWLVAINAVNPMLTFTIETVHDFPNKRLAMDMEIEVVENQIPYSYNRKPMKTPLVMGENTAMSQQQKFSILSNEIIRRLSNVSEDRTIEERTSIVDQFTAEI